MNAIRLSALLCAALLLPACDQLNPAAQSSAASAPAASAASAPAADEGSELKTPDGKIVIKTFGSYTDKLGDAAAYPEGLNAEQLLLLQHNAAYNTTIYAAKLGKTDKKQEAYFAALKKALENGKGLKSAAVDEQEKGDRLSYRFSQTDADGDITLNESCTVFYGSDSELYSVCAFSGEVQPDDLAEIIKDTTFN